MGNDLPAALRGIAGGACYRIGGKRRHRLEFALGLTVCNAPFSAVVREAKHQQ